MVRLASTWGIAAVALVACGSDDVRAPSDAARAAIAATPPAPSCPDAIPIWTDGRAAGAVCAKDVAARGLTIVDLSDGWTPAALTPAPGAPPISYRATYLALAHEDWRGAGADAERAQDDRYLELYGIEPTFSVIRARLADLPRHACHAAIPDLPIARMTGTIREESRDESNRRLWGARALWNEIARLRAAKRLTPAAMAALIDSEVRLAGIETVQRHLVCDGLYDKSFIDGNYTWQTSTPIEQLQRGAMVLPTGWLDPDTRAALLVGSRERDFRTALRALRERVIAATGLIEDGTAGAGMTTVEGRLLEPRSTWRAKGYAPAPDAAPDLISPATDAAAHALGWNDASSVLAFLDAHGPGSAQPMPEVAVALPPPPPWHAAQMDLSVEIDRGDVWYDPVPIAHTPTRRPALTLYATVGARRIALVRWPTTIGGWQDEKSEAAEVDKKWKESSVGRRVWHDLWVAPTWIPPDGTPDKDLIRVGADERYHLRRDVLGPGYRSAFGLTAFVHQVPVKRRSGLTYDEEGIRTHGAANLSSIATGISHGCHRLLGVDALRMAGFVLAHRSHTARGEQDTIWKRIVRYKTRTFPAEVRTRGYLVEIDPPVPVNVLRGTIRSARKRPYPFTR